MAAEDNERRRSREFEPADREQLVADLANDADRHADLLHGHVQFMRMADNLMRVFVLVVVLATTMVIIEKRVVPILKLIRRQMNHTQADEESSFHPDIRDSDCAADDITIGFTPTLLWKDPLNHYTEMRKDDSGEITMWVQSGDEWMNVAPVEEFHFGDGMWGFDTFSVLDPQNGQMKFVTTGITRDELLDYFMECEKPMASMWGVPTKEGWSETLAIAKKDGSYPDVRTGSLKKFLLLPPGVDPEGNFMWFEYGGISYLSRKKGKPRHFVQFVDTICYKRNHAEKDGRERVLLEFSGRTFTPQPKWKAGMEGEGLWEGEWYPMMIERKLNINGGHSFGDGTEPLYSVLWTEEGLRSIIPGSHLRPTHKYGIENPTRCHSVFVEEWDELMRYAKIINDRAVAAGDEMPIDIQEFCDFTPMDDDLQDIFGFAHF